MTDPDKVAAASLAAIARLHELLATLVAVAPAIDAYEVRVSIELRAEGDGAWADHGAVIRSVSADVEDDA